MVNPSALIPLTDKIPVSWGYIQFLLLLTFVLHILFMNVMLGGAVIALVGAIRNKTPHAMNVSENLSGKIPFLVAFTVNLGVAPLLFIQVLYGHFIYVSSILMGIFWLSIILILIAAYYSLYIFKMKFQSLGKLRILFMSIAVIALFVIGFFFSNNMTLMLQPDQWDRYFQHSNGSLLNLSDPTLFPRYLHFMIASVAIGGLFVSILGHFKGKSDTDTGLRMKQNGFKWFFHATLVQVFIGILFLITLPRDIMLEFMGGNMVYTITLLIGIMMAVFSLLAAAKQKLAFTTITAVLTVVLMAVVRDFLRVSYLKDYFTLSSLEVLPQYSPMIVFFVVFAGGLLLVYIMLKWAYDASMEVAK